MNLEELTKTQLKDLARWRGIEFPSRILKQELLELIKEAQKEPLPPMSARVRRLRELNKGEN